ncbi:L10-interacting MYB domain-containing protein-like [Henckelia pumila]|uniref:L10-interacting MYB domain-containing protein-like n=1 Tax=Henckelia pumila TaxID=405737 RepID=UPI003C6E811F
MDSQMPWARRSDTNFQMYSQPLSQPSQSVDASRQQTTRITECIGKANWDRASTEVFIKICLEELQARNRLGTHFNKSGWENLVRKFEARTSRKYSKIQLKNRWDNLKKEWSIWKTLLRGETGLRWNHEKGTVDATPEWWQRKIQARPEAAKFKERGPLLVHDQDLLFSDVVAEGNSEWAPSSGILPSHLQDEHEDDINIHSGEVNGPDIDYTTETNDTQQTNMESGLSRRNIRNNPFSAPIRHKKQKKSSIAEKIARCLERMVNTIESESQLSRLTTDSVGNYTIKDCMEVLDCMSGIEEGGSLWMYATRLFLKPAVRELFLTIKRDDLRLKWLQDQMERDMQRRTSSMTSAHASRGESYHNDNASFG